MGARLESTAQSVNIKERLDFSCALFDPDGNLVANAPHIPVHLGSMGTSVKEVIRRRAGRMRPGDVYAVNDPYHGGTHLPDITVITPVFDTHRRPARRTRPAAGTRRGSCSTSPPAATTPRSAASPPAPCPPTAAASTRRACCSTTGCSSRTAGSARRRPGACSPRRPTPPATRTPTSPTCAPRSPPTRKGVDEVGKMIDHFGLDVVQAYMRHVQDNAEEAVRRVIDTLDDGEYRYEMDSGAVHRREDHRGPRRPRRHHRLHRHLAAAGHQLQRALLGGQRRRALRLPHPRRRRHPAQRRLPAPAATSSSRPAPCSPRCTPPPSSRATSRPPRRSPARSTPRLGVQAEGSGTMNNVTFGNERHQYYETVGLRLRRGRRLPRRTRRADPHDQLPAHRPRGPRVAIPGAARGVRRPPRQRRRPADGAAATAPSAASGSASR